MHRLPATLILFIAMTAATAADSLEPGLYEVVTKTTDEQPTTTRQCVTAADIAKGLTMGELDKSCKATRRTMASGKIDFLATCADATITMAGSYTATTFNIDSRMQGRSGGQAFDIDTQLSAKKVAGSCKKD